jgi:hypothetical protein
MLKDAPALATTNELERRLERLLATLGIGYGQDEEAAVLALINRLHELGEQPTRICREAVRHLPKWR